MRTRIETLLCHALLGTALILGCVVPDFARSGGANPEGSHPVVVLELFTSQGCSSCPSADRLLSKLGADERLRGRVVPLAFHVDYWNYIGWSDPFSSADWSARQEAYQRALALADVYTPQLVVNGRAQLNGTDEAGVLRQIEAATTSPARVSFTISSEGTKRLAVDVRAETAEALDAGKLDAIVVVYESGITTAIKRGENSGRTLENDYVVRRLQRAFSFKPEAGATGQGRVSIDLDKTWTAPNVGIAVFLQDPKTMRIYGAAAK